MFLQTLSHNELNDLLEYLKTYKLQYKNKVNLPENLTFGIEIEGVGSHFDNFKDKIYAEDWDVKEEFTLFAKGAEVVSPILRNNEESWQNIEYICNLLRLNGIYVNDRCAGQIHYGHDGLIDEAPEKLLNIFKLWAAYEPIIYKYAAGNFANWRCGIWDLAKPNADYIKKVVKNIGDNLYNYKTMLLLLRKDRQYYGLNIENLSNYLMANKSNAKNTIEVRVPDGTLNPIIWQNNIRFFGSLFTCATKANFDNEKIKQLINKLPFNLCDNYGKNDFSFYGETNLQLAIELADTIFTDENDKYSFLAQYLYGDATHQEGHQKKRGPIFK